MGFAVASLLQSRGSRRVSFSSCGTQALVPCGMWDLPRARIKPTPPVFTGRFSTTGPPGKSHSLLSDAFPSCGFQVMTPLVPSVLPVPSYTLLWFLSSLLTSKHRAHQGSSLFHLYSWDDLTRFWVSSRCGLPSLEPCRGFFPWTPDTYSHLPTWHVYSNAYWEFTLMFARPLINLLSCHLLHLCKWRFHPSVAQTKILGASLMPFFFSHFIIQSVMKFGHRHFQNSPRMWPLFSPLLLSQSQPPSSLGWMIAVVFYLVFCFCHCSRQSSQFRCWNISHILSSFCLDLSPVFRSHPRWKQCPCIHFCDLPWWVPAAYCLSFLIQLQPLVPWLFLEQSQHTAASGPLHSLLPSPGTLSPVTLA